MAAHAPESNDADAELLETLRTVIGVESAERLLSVSNHARRSAVEILREAIDAAWSIEFDEELTRHLTLLDDEP